MQFQDDTMPTVVDHIINVRLGTGGGVLDCELEDKVRYTFMQNRKELLLGECYTGSDLSKVHRDLFFGDRTFSLTLIMNNRVLDDVRILTSAGKLLLVGCASFNAARG
jgi:hypothetical protein